jgi:hypothetical protein
MVSSRPLHVARWWRDRRTGVGRRSPDTTRARTPPATHERTGPRAETHTRPRPAPAPPRRRARRRRGAPAAGGGRARTKEHYTATFPIGIEFAISHPLHRRPLKHDQKPLLGPRVTAHRVITFFQYPLHGLSLNTQRRDVQFLHTTHAPPPICASYQILPGWDTVCKQSTPATAAYCAPRVSLKRAPVPRAADAVPAICVRCGCAARRRG